MEKNNVKNITNMLASFGGLVPTVLVTIIVVGAFFLGSLWTKVQMLEKGTGNPTVVNAPSGGDNAPQAAAKQPTIQKDDHVRGDSRAPIALIEYSDLECPFCKTFHATAKKIVDEYDGKVRWIYRHYPLSFHANAQKEAEASECVAKLGGEDAFWKFIDAIYERTTANGTGFALEKLGPLANEVGVNQQQFQACLDSDEMAQKVKDHMALGTSEGVTGTPGNILLDIKSGETKLIPGALPFEQFKTTIDEMLK